jgi:hypothetical protein
MTRSPRIRLLIVTVALLSIAVAAIVPVYAQKLGPDGASNMPSRRRRRLRRRQIRFW